MGFNCTSPATFSIEFRKKSLLSFQLRTSLILPLSPEETFTFFEDPRNLCEITPHWLDFRMCEREKCEVFEGAEFDYTIRWFGLQLPWKSRIVDYMPPERFTDIQVRGPYRSWRHVHTFEKIPEGTLTKDDVSYSLSPFAAPFHGLLIKRRLRDIFTYRAVKMQSWADGESNK